MATGELVVPDADVDSLAPSASVLTIQSPMASSPKVTTEHAKSQRPGHYEIGFSEVVGASDEVHWEQTRGTVASRAVLNDMNRIELGVAGPAPQNEEGAFDACERLVRVLNSRGASWGEVVEPASRRADDVDGWAVDASGEKLELQVVRAGGKNSLRWKRMNTAGRVDEALDCDEPANELFESIQKKTKYPDSQRRKLTLVLDADKLPSHTFEPVLASFRRRHAAMCKGYGFSSIWIVGSHDALVWRLDD